ncbi:hypothetical protein Tcan_15370 [Toxocara canis]|uniref:Uncharacterized protein n=2 Tax=Toxocara canis TaxID=6265 RepID=A0A0B2UUU8_TOXCA|nr:hypothetical protein Tcan_15370 [Toxocara canis]VDM47474.1 unnamed protein product [Toxocara canis]
MRYILLLAAFFLASLSSEGRFIQDALASPSRRAYNFADYVSLPLWSEEVAKPCLPFFDCAITNKKRTGFDDYEEMTNEEVSLLNATM